MRVPRTPAVATVVALVAVATCGLAGCSDDDAPVDTTPRESPSSSTPTSTPAEPTSTPPSPEPTSTPPTTPSSPPATENTMPQACAVVTPQQVSDILFVPVEQSTIGEGACRYAVAGDDTAPAIEFVQTAGFTAADLAEAKDTAVQRTDGQVRPVEQVGDEAFFAIGPGDSGQLTGAGGVLVGTTFVQVTVTQSQDLIEPEVGQYTIDAVGLAGDALGG